LGDALVPQESIHPRGYPHRTCGPSSGHPNLRDGGAAESARISKKDRIKIDPFTIQDAETLIAAIRRDWGEAQGNYDEFRFFTGMRPSEQIALLVSDFDVARGSLSVTRARVAGIDKDSTKTGEDRHMALCPRALNVMNRQLALRKRLELEGKIYHDHLFFKKNGEPSIAFITHIAVGDGRWHGTRQSAIENPTAPAIPPSVGT
jgi:integrase